MYTIPSPVRVEPFVWKCVTGTNMVLARFLWSMIWWCQLDPAEPFAFHDTLLLIWLLMWEPNQTRLFQILGIWNISWKTGNAIWHGTCLWCLATGWSYGPKELPAETFAFAFANRPFGRCDIFVINTPLCVIRLLPCMVLASYARFLWCHGVMVPEGPRWGFCISWHAAATNLIAGLPYGRCVTYLPPTHLCGYLT